MSARTTGSADAFRQRGVQGTRWRRQYLACVAAATPSVAAASIAAYGPSGTCWTSEASPSRPASPRARPGSRISRSRARAHVLSARAIRTARARRPHARGASASRARATRTASRRARPTATRSPPRASAAWPTRVSAIPARHASQSPAKRASARRGPGGVSEGRAKWARFAVPYAVDEGSTRAMPARSRECAAQDVRRRHWAGGDGAGARASIDRRREGARASLFGEGHADAILGERMTSPAARGMVAPCGRE